MGELDWTKDAGRVLYRSKDRKSTGAIPSGSFMLNKKWTLVEELCNHIMRFQQVTVRFIDFSIVIILTFRLDWLSLNQR